MNQEIDREGCGSQDRKRTATGVRSINGTRSSACGLQCGSHHLHGYLSEFDFRYNHRAALEINDEQRADVLAGSAAGA